jgi:DNA-binding winged helix-turn-helix (wHTH) protein
MTWPQYRRNQCSIESFVIDLTDVEAELLSILLVRYPEPVMLDDLIGAAYPDPDLEPDDARGAVTERMRNLARKLGAFRIKTNGRFRGYWLCQKPEDIGIAA